MLTLGACSSGEAEPGVSPTAPRAEPTVESTPEPEPSPTETTRSGPVDRTDEELGLVVGDLPEVEAGERAVLDAYTLFELEHWRALREGEIGDDLRLLASPEALATVENQISGNAEGGWTVAGMSRVEVLDVQANEGVGLVEACLDPRGNTFTNDEGTQSGADYGMEASVVVAELSRSGGTWTVVRYDVGGGESC